MNPNAENNLRKRMQEYASPINLDNEWGVLTNRLNKEKKRKRQFIFIFFSFGVFAASFLLYSSLQNYKIVSANKIESIDNRNIDNPVANKTQKSLSPNSQSKVEQNKYSAVELIINNTNEENLKSKTSSEYVKSKEKNALGQAQHNNQNAGNRAATKDRQYKTKSFEEESPSYFINQNNFIGSQLSPLDKEDKLILTTQNLGIQSIPPLYLNELSFKKRERIVLAALPIISSSNSLNKRSIEIYGGVGLLYSPQNFKAIRPEPEALISIKQNSERTLETYSIDMGFRNYINNRIFIYGELSYMQGYTKLSYLETKAHNYIIENALSEVIAFKRIEPREIYRDEEVEGIRKTSYLNYNKFIAWNGSLGFGKNIIHTKKLSLDISLGLGWNIKSNVSGLTTDNQQGIIRVVNVNEVYKKSFGLSTEAALLLMYPISEQLSLEFRPILRYYNASITQADYGVASKLYRVGAIIGISYKLR